MSETDLIALLDGWITDARKFDNSDLAAQRELAIRFYNGEVDFAAEEGRSEAVSADVADTVEWLLPSLLRVFTAADNIVRFEPDKPGEEVAAKEASDAVNVIFKTDCDGYRVLLYGFHDGLLHGNGIVKTWWEGSPEYKTEVVRGLTEQELQMLAAQPDVDEVLEISKNIGGIPEDEAKGAY